MLKEKIRAQILYGSLKNYKNHLAGLAGAYYSEYAVGVGLTILASIRTIINTFKESMGSYKFKKVNE